MFSLNLFMNWCGAFFCFLPIFLDWNFDISGYDSDQSIRLLQSLSSKSYEFSLVASIAISIPLICEQAVDSVLAVLNKSGSRCATYEIVVFFKWTLLIALLIPNLALLCMLPRSEEYIYIPIIFNSRQIILSHVLFSFLGTYGSPIWNSQMTNLCSIIFNAALILDCYTAFIIPYLQIIIVIKFTLYFVCSVLVLWTVFRWLIYIRSRLNAKWEGLTMNEYYCNVHLVALAVGAGGLWGLAIVYGNTLWADATASNLCMYAYTEIAYTVLLSVWNGRLARWEMTQTKTELETKRMFVRYVSHEIRTPLNTVGMGLQLLRAELAKIRDNEAMLDIVQDLGVSCDTAVDILNDLLTYEKLTANILQLDSAVISVKQFVSEVVRPFFMQARQAGIELSVVFGGDLLDESVDVNIFGDKNKLSQVVRNLVSNALKFTKRNGRVTVSISVCSRDKIIAANEPAADHKDRKSSNRFLFMPTIFSPHSRIYIVNSTSRRNLDGGRQEEVVAKAPPPKTAGPPSQSHMQNVPLLKIAVIDTGLGISQENQKRLFKEIVQFNPGELQDGKGSGLGLWISSRIMELHGGDLTVFSNGVGHGCTFTIITPLREVVVLPPLARLESAESSSCPPSSSSLRSHNDSLKIPISSRLGTLEQPGSHRKCSSKREKTEPSTLLAATDEISTFYADVSSSPTVHSRLDDTIEDVSRRNSHFLLVDDAPMNRKMLNRLLKDRCGIISEAEDGKQALDMVLATLRDPSRPAIDVVIMDNLMPVMDGPTAVREMRSAGYRGVVIGLTGNALPADIQWFLSHGADRVMIKPCNMEELDGILNDLMGVSDSGDAGAHTDT